MFETIITSVTQIITTLITVGVTILVAYRTYCSQRNKADRETERLQLINCRSSLELFSAYVANLILFASPSKIQLHTEDLQICLQKMKLIEQYLSELTETDLPDTFIEKFRLYRLKLSFHRITLENRLKDVSETLVDSSMFEDLETLELITSVKKFISEYSSIKDPEKN
ncbi:MAG: hypothetical protein K2O15_07410 [Lachnospiraceae bacterium]|nr:hypothetical protein [Lachnospiraceae bacterium]